MPWSAPIVAAHLGLFWRYAGGAGWPASTSAARRENRRANAVGGDLGGMAVVAGLLGLGTIVVLMRVLSRMVTIPTEASVDISRASIVTLFYLVTASALVSGIVEETSFRGYLQRPIERRYGFLVAVLISGSIFGLAHFTHPGVGLALLPYYIAVSAVYGGLAYLTDSVFPSMVLHAFGNFFGGIGVIFGRGDWAKEVASPAPTIWVTGPDGDFWVSLLMLAVVGGVTTAAYLAMAKQRTPS